MSNPIQEKASAWWNLITGQETTNTYKNFFVRTWIILKETAWLIWLLLCFTLVAIGWVWEGSLRLRDNITTWRSEIGQQKESNLFADAGTKLWGVTTTTTAKALENARKQLNIEPPPSREPAVKKPPAQVEHQVQATVKAPEVPPEPSSGAKLKPLNEYKEEQTADSSTPRNNGDPWDNETEGEPSS